MANTIEKLPPDQSKYRVQLPATEPTELNDHIEDRVKNSRYIAALVSTVAESVPGFERTFQRHLATLPGRDSTP